MKTREILIYKTAEGREPYSAYVDGMRDRHAAAKMKTRVVRAQLGNLGQYRPVGHGVLELKIDFGPGYRIYVGMKGLDLMILLCAGDKKTQDRDILRAQDYWKDAKEWL